MHNILTGRLSRSLAFDWGSQAGRDTGQVEKTEQARDFEASEREFSWNSEIWK